MKTIILPGFSLKNRDWANNVKDSLQRDVVVHKWKHWETGENKDFNVQNECGAIEFLIGNDPVQIIAKSIGTFIAVKLLPEIHSKLEKLIICGIPVNDLSEDELETYDNLTILDPEKLTVIQNKNDNHGSLIQASELLRNIKVDIIEKSRDDHHYPYYEEFRSLLG